MNMLIIVVSSINLLTPHQVNGVPVLHIMFSDKIWT